MIMKMRGWPMIITSTTEARPTSAPTSTTSAASPVADARPRR
jgi:hypothetical protein